MPRVNRTLLSDNSGIAETIAATPAAV